MSKLKEEIKVMSSEIVSDQKQRIKKFRKKNGSLGNLVIVIVSLLICVVTFTVVKSMLFTGISNFATAFDNASDSAYKKTYEEYYDSAYQKAYEKAKRENAINNDIHIMVDNIREMSRYEVFSVIEDAIVVQTNEQKDNHIYSWMRYKGKGEFSVDLEQSEIIVDHNNYYVSIKIPHPKMIYVPLREETEELLYKDERTSYVFFKKKDLETGYDIAKEQESKGNEIIYEKLTSNPEYMEKANEAAIDGLARLVRTLNSEVADKLTIEINFND